MNQRERHYEYLRSSAYVPETLAIHLQVFIEE